MKNFIKKNAMALAAFAIAGTTLMSFGLEKSSQSYTWHEFTPGTAAPNPLDPSQYTPIGNTSPSGCLSGQNICAIRTEDGEELTEDRLQELNDSGEMSGPSNNANVVFKQ